MVHCWSPLWFHDPQCETAGLLCFAWIQQTYLKPFTFYLWRKHEWLINLKWQCKADYTQVAELPHQTTTHIAHTGCPFGQVVEGPGEVEEGSVESTEQRQTLLDGKHSRYAGLPLGRRQQTDCPPHPLPQPGPRAPPALGTLPSPPSLPSVVVLICLQLVFQTHQEFVQKVGYEGVAKNQGSASGPRGNLAFGGIKLDDVDVLFSQGLVAWMIIVLTFQVEGNVHVLWQ